MMMSKTQNYAWDANDYAKNSQNQFQWAKELIPKLKLQGNEALLDIGCGDGKITAELSKSLPNGRAVGVDNSNEMIRLAQKMFPFEDYPNLLFKVLDARQLCFEGEFDLAFSNAALHWIVDQKAVLGGVARSLKPGGRLLFQMAGKGNARGILSIINELSAVEPWKTYFEGMVFPYGFFDPQEYRQFLTAAGLKVVRVELLDRDMKHQGREGLTGWVRTTWLPFTDRLPESLKQKFVESIINRYLYLQPPDHAGVVHVSIVRLEVEAYKP
jgi:trans-aconitate 2-methyltransferase